MTKDKKQTKNKKVINDTEKYEKTISSLKRKIAKLENVSVDTYEEKYDTLYGLYRSKDKECESLKHSLKDCQLRCRQLLDLILKLSDEK